jgi:hypothetical protein
MSGAEPEIKEQASSAEIEELKKQNRELTVSLLQERIMRINFQIQLLSEWRQRSQLELNNLLQSEPPGTEDA